MYNRVRFVFSFIVNPPEFNSSYSFHVKIVPSCGLFGSCRQKMRGLTWLLRGTRAVGAYGHALSHFGNICAIMTQND